MQKLNYGSFYTERDSQGIAATVSDERTISKMSSNQVDILIIHVPPDNNASERALRNSVIHRKVIGGFRLQWGADAHAVVASVVDPARKWGDAIFDTLLSHLGPATPISGVTSA